MAKRKRQPKIQYQLDIVIPVYGRPDLLQKCLESIEATIGDIAAKIILVDDCGPNPEMTEAIYRSLNGSHQVVRPGPFDRLRMHSLCIIRHQTNQGFSRTVNDGIARGSAPLVVTINTDIVLKPGCLQAMMAEFDTASVGVVGPKLLFPRESQDPQRPAGQVQHAGLAIDFGGNVFHTNIAWPADHPKVNERRSVQAVTGALLMMRRAMLDKVTQGYRQGGDPTRGPLNEVYGKGVYEDVELCFAARAAGYEVIYTPLGEAYHEVGASVGQDGGKYPIDRNSMIFNARCGPLLIWDEVLFALDLNLVRG